MYSLFSLIPEGIKEKMIKQSAANYTLNVNTNSYLKITRGNVLRDIDLMMKNIEGS